MGFRAHTDARLGRSRSSRHGRHGPATGVQGVPSQGAARSPGRARQGRGRAHALTPDLSFSNFSLDRASCRWLAAPWFVRVPKGALRRSASADIWSTSSCVAPYRRAGAGSAWHAPGLPSDPTNLLLFWKLLRAVPPDASLYSLASFARCLSPASARASSGAATPGTAAIHKYRIRGSRPAHSIPVYPWNRAYSQHVSRSQGRHIFVFPLAHD